MFPRTLDAPPPFLLVCDLGYCFDVYASFDGTGVYRAFPMATASESSSQTSPQQADLLRAIWTEPLSLDPSKGSAAVTRDIAEQIAALARALSRRRGTTPSWSLPS